MTAPPNNFGQLLRELHARAAVSRQPLNGTFELTSRCNLACRMCYVRTAAADRAARDRELTSEAWLALARDAVDTGMVFLLLTGGEIFLRPDFFDIYEPLTRMGLVLTLYSNGTLITDSVAQRLAEVPPSRIEITLYGASAETYKRITGTSGSFARCCAGIDSLLKQRIPLALRTTVTRQNAADVQAMKQMADNWGLDFSVDWLLSRRRDGTASDVDECRLTPSDCVAMEEMHSAPLSESSETASPTPPQPSNENFYCNAGQAAFVISPEGEMNVCLDLAYPKARPLEIGFRAAWEEVRRFVDGSPPAAPTCVACEARDYCPRCPAWSALETQTLTDPVPYLCRLAHARKNSTRKET